MPFKKPRKSSTNQKKYKYYKKYQKQYQKRHRKKSKKCYVISPKDMKKITPQKSKSQHVLFMLSSTNITYDKTIFKTS